MADPSHRAVEVDLQEGSLRPWQAPDLPEMTGAWVVFEGVVRPEEGGLAISGLYYEVYPVMARRQLERLAGEAVRRFGILSIAVFHSHGWVPAGETSFRLAIASRHRKEAFEAMNWFIDTLKQDVPIWKSSSAPLSR